MIHMTIDVLGALALGVIAGFLGMLIYHILLAFAKAWSWHRWALKIAYRYDDTGLEWKGIPTSFLIMWWEMLTGHTTSSHLDYGHWYGIGKWVVYPKNEVKNIWEEE